MKNRINALILFAASLFSNCQPLPAQFLETQKPYLSAINVVPNAGFENGKAQWTAASGTFSIITNGVNLGFGSGSASFATSSSSAKLTSAAQAVPTGLFANSCQASIFYKTAATFYQLKVVDGAGTLIGSATLNLAAASTYTPVKIKFTCPSSGSFSIQIASSSATSSTIFLDNAALGSTDAPSLIVNADVDPAAAIAYSKLNLASSIATGDLASALLVPSSKGGTGVNNAGTLTYGSSNITLTTSGTTGVTLPTSGTLSTLAGSEALSNKTISSSSASLTQVAIPRTELGTIGTSNDIATAGISFIKYTGASPATYTGFANGADGRILVVENGGSSTLTLARNSGSSLAANRIQISPDTLDLVLGADGIATMVYDGGSSMWKVLANSGFTPIVLITGSVTGGDLSAGILGEPKSVNSAGVTPASSTNFVNIASLALTAGDWDCDATGELAPVTLVGLTRVTVGISATTGTIDSTSNGGYFSVDVTYGLTHNMYFPVSRRRFTIGSPATIFLVGRIDYSSLGTTTWGTDSRLYCRRGG